MDAKTKQFRTATQHLKDAHRASQQERNERVVALLYLLKLCIEDLEISHGKQVQSYIITKDRQVTWITDDRA